MSLRNTLTCREAARLLLEDEDHEIPAADRLALQLHVRVCFACARFVSQLNLMRRATRAWRKHSETGDDEAIIE
jgi:hypothetical protein